MCQRSLDCTESPLCPKVHPSLLWFLGLQRGRSILSGDSKATAVEELLQDSGYPLNDFNSESIDLLDSGEKVDVEFSTSMYAEVMAELWFLMLVNSCHQYIFESCGSDGLVLSKALALGRLSKLLGQLRACIMGYPLVGCLSVVFVEAEWFWISSLFKKRRGLPFVSLVRISVIPWLKLVVPEGVELSISLKKLGTKRLTTLDNTIKTVVILAPKNCYEFTAIIESKRARMGSAEKLANIRLISDTDRPKHVKQINLYDSGNPKKNHALSNQVKNTQSSIFQESKNSRTTISKPNQDPGDPAQSLAISLGWVKAQQESRLDKSERS
ncbi:hypothetical protein CLU79DRAFT_837474 [Phycomyces nitens]|nr:hypothetical protein CLU79DRAFT_837474 [Phycomyces nitens]